MLNDNGANIRILLAAEDYSSVSKYRYYLLSQRYQHLLPLSQV